MDPRYDENTAESTADVRGIEISTDDLGCDLHESEELDLASFMTAANEAHLAMRRMKEPLFQLLKIRDALQDALETDRMGRDAEFANFVNETFGLRMMSQITREKSGDEEVRFRRVSCELNS